MKFQAHLLIKFSGERILTATYLIDRYPTPILDHKTPFEALIRKPPSYSHLRVFGCLCFAFTLKSQKDKFSAKAIKCIFIDYPFGKKACTLFYLTSHKIIHSRDVHFYEHVFPYQTITSDSSSPSVMSPSLSSSPSDDELYATTHSDIPPFETSPSNVPATDIRSISPMSISSIPPTTNESSSISTSPNESSSPTSSASSSPPIPDPPVISRPTRTRILPARYHEYAGLPSSTVVSNSSLSFSQLFVL